MESGAPSEGRSPARVGAAKPASYGPETAGGLCSARNSRRAGLLPHSRTCACARARGVPGRALLLLRRLAALAAPSAQACLVEESRRKSRRVDGCGTAHARCVGRSWCDEQRCRWSRWRRRATWCPCAFGTQDRVGLAGEKHQVDRVTHSRCRAPLPARRTGCQRYRWRPLQCSLGQGTHVAAPPHTMAIAGRRV